MCSSDLYVKAQHRKGQLTLVIANTVDRAQEIWTGLKSMGAVLLHSRFRPCDRRGVEKAVLQKGYSGVIVSTQVIEAGVDLDADLLITDVAPWASLVQRFGRVNRRGGKAGRIYWVRNPQRQKSAPRNDGAQYKPYNADEVNEAVTVLNGLASAAPADLPVASMRLPYRYVLRRRDLLDLFDTTPDLAGNHIDVSRFVRSGDETNVYVAWRNWPEKEAPPRRGFLTDELCPVSYFPAGGKDVRELRDLLKRSGGGWIWNYTKRGRWEKINWQDPIYAGMRLLLRSDAGGYDPDHGWTPDGKQPVAPTQGSAREENSTDADIESETTAQTLRDHTEHVVQELETLLEALRMELGGARNGLREAARFHDWGKAHPVFQQTLHDLTDTPEQAPWPLLAKQSRESAARKHSRAWFRHELASALAMWKERRSFLATYLVAAHHGKVRVNVRSMPGEVDINRPRVRLARGIADGDVLFAADLGGDTEMAPAHLSLDLTELGAGWGDEMARLLLEYGPFRLAYLECVLRTADARASAKETEAK